MLGFSDSEVPGKAGAVHPMLHVDDYDFAYESLHDYTVGNPALAQPSREGLSRIFYSNFIGGANDSAEVGGANDSAEDAR